MSSKYMKTLSKFVQKATKTSIEVIDAETVEEARRRVEKQFGKPMVISTRRNLVGRGNTNSSKLIQHSQIERDLDKCLK
ncbi:MAG: hypothetical protein U0R49_11580 [Fimbriimonadales bacterium]